MEYIKRIVDLEIDRRVKAFNAINIVGPKGCGKTRSAKERSKTIIEFQDVKLRAAYLNMAKNNPEMFLNGEKPILFDEWQDAPEIWDLLRKECDDYPEEVGQYFLTGSTSKKVEKNHTGTGRISTINMFPMTIYETKESTGEISISKILEDKDYSIDGKKSNLNVNDIAYLMCRGGWPRCMALTNSQAKLDIAKDYYRQIYKEDISSIDKVKRNSEIARTILWSYARNMATTAKKQNIYADVKANFDVSDVTISSYINALENLYVLKDIDAWTPQIRSKTAIRSSKKHIFIDPSIALASLNIGPDYFMKDYDLFGHAFENLVLRDLLAYADAHDAKIMHYRDDLGLEVDAIYQAANGEYALIEIKLGVNAVDKASESLLKFKDLIKKHNEEVSKDKKHPGVLYREPSALIFISGNGPMAYTTKDNIKVIPFGCLKD